MLENAVKTSDLVGGGLLNNQQAKRFVDLVVDQSVMLREARVVRMRSAVSELDRIATTGRVSQLKSEGMPPASLSAPSFSKVTLTAVDIITPFEITFEALEDSIEGGSLEDTVIRVMTKQTASDLEELAICGDCDSQDAFLQGMEGWRKQAGDGHIVDLEGAPLDKDGLSSMFRALPDAYKRKYGELRYFLAPTTAQDWHDDFASSGSSAGDKALTGGGLPPYMGVPIVTVPAIPTNLSGVGDHTGTDLSYGFLTPRDNLVFGIHRDIRIDRDKDVLRGVNIYAITTRVAVAFENTDAVVLAVNIGTQ